MTNAHQLLSVAREEKSTQKTMELLEKAAKKDDRSAQFLVAEGFLVQKNFKQYEHYMRMAAKESSGKQTSEDAQIELAAQLSLGSIYFDTLTRNDQFNIDEFPDLAIKKGYPWIERAVKKTKDPVALLYQALYANANLLLPSLNRIDAFKIFRDLGKNGNSHGWYRLARMVIDVPEDVKKLIEPGYATPQEYSNKLMLLAAEQGNLQAMSEVCGYDIDSRYAHYLKTAAEQDNSAACINLGLRYIECNGEFKGTAESRLRKGIYWLEKGIAFGANTSDIKKILRPYKTLLSQLDKDSPERKEFENKILQIEKLKPEVHAITYDYQEAVQCSLSHKRDSLVIVNVPDRISVPIKRKLLTWNICELDDSAKHNPLAHRLQTLLKDQGLTSEMKGLFSLYQQRERFGEYAQQELERQISKCEKQYGISSLDDSSDDSSADKKSENPPAKAEHKHDPKDYALDLDDQRTLKRLIKESKDPKDSQLQYIQTVLELRATLSKEIKKDDVAQKEIHRLENEIKQSNSDKGKLYAEQALYFLLRNDLSQARQNLFKRITYGSVKSQTEPLIVAAIAILRAEQGDYQRALDHINAFKSADIDVRTAFAIVCVKAGKFSDAIDYFISGEANKIKPPLSTHLANAVQEHLTKLEKDNNKIQIENDLGVLKKWNNSVVQAWTRKYTPSKVQEPVKSESFIPKQEREVKQTKLEAMLDRESTPKSHSEPTSRSGQRRKKAKLKAQQEHKDGPIKTFAPLNVAPGKDELPDVPDHDGDTKQENKSHEISSPITDPQEIWTQRITENLARSKRVATDEELKREMKQLTESDLIFETDPIIGKLKRAFEERDYRMKIVGGAARHKLEGLANKVKCTATLEDYDLVIDRVMTPYDMNYLCKELNLPEPRFLKKLNVFQIKHDKIKIDIICDPELFTENATSAILKRRSARDSLVAAPIESKEEKVRFKVEDPSGQGISSILRGVNIPLTSPDTWGKKARDEKDSSYWIALFRFLKSIALGYKMKQKDIKPFVKMISSLRHVLKYAHVKHHFADHLKKCFLGGHAAAIFPVLAETNVIKQIFPFLQGMDLFPGKPAYDRMLTHFKKIDEQYAASKTNKQLRPTINSVYGAIIAAKLCHQKADEVNGLIEFVQANLIRVKDLHAVVNQYFDGIANNTGTDYIKQMINDTPILTVIDKSSQYVVPLEWEARNQVVLHIAAAIQNRKLNLPNLRTEAQLGTINLFQPQVKGLDGTRQPVVITDSGLIRLPSHSS